MDDMGLYDMLKCNYPLPDLPEPKVPYSYQTKSLNSMLDNYTITKDGLLLDWQNKPIDFIGVINFYTSPNKTYDDDDWVEYWAKFENGKIIRVSKYRLD